MRDIAELVHGYRTFMRERWSRQEELHRTLAEEGQQPRTMVVACCDSRADPAMIFDAHPGELFVVRNVANLVPPCEPDGEYHGTSAALEFAVTGLNVRNIVVMGHGRCGGIQAFLRAGDKAPVPGDFIGRWMSIMTDARTEALRVAAGASPEELQRVMEHLSIRHSLANLGNFPFVAEAVRSGTLHLHGAWFDISTGELMSLDRDSGTFERVV